MDGGLAEDESGFLYGGSRLALLVKFVEDSTRVGTLALFQFWLNGDRSGRGLAGFEEIVDNPASIPAGAHFPLLLNGGSNVGGFANFDELGEGFISFSDEASCTAAHFPTAAKTFHVNDVGPCDGLDRRCGGHGASNGVHNPDRSAKNGGGRAEDQGGKEESRG
jgi:hypothetical protein